MAPEPRPPLTTCREFAALLDYSLVRPEWNSAAVLAGLQEARGLEVASAVVRPCDLDLAVRTLEGCPVKPAGIAGYPYGFQTTAVKLYELRDLLRRGAREIELFLALPALLSREFQYVQTELLQASEACRREGVLLKVILPAIPVAEDLKIIACGCCERAEVEMVQPPAPSDLPLFRLRLPEEISLKAAGAIDTLEQALAAYQAGCSRVQCDSPAAILEEWRQKSSSGSEA